MTETETKPATRTIEQVYEIGAAPERVFTALTEPERIQSWWGSKATVQRKVGGQYKIEFEFDDAAKNMTQDAKVTTYEPTNVLAFSWDTPLGASTEVRFEFSAEDDGSKLVMKHTGFGTGGPWDEYMAKIAGGWEYYLGNLKSVLENKKDVREGTGQVLDKGA